MADKHAYAQGSAAPEGDEWLEDTQLPPLLRAKLLALKVCRKRCLAQAGSAIAGDIARPVLRMFVTLLENTGALRADSDDECAIPSFIQYSACGADACRPQRRGQGAHARAGGRLAAAPRDR
jgi:hypothetical protein